MTFYKDKDILKGFFGTLGAIILLGSPLVIGCNPLAPSKPKSITLKAPAINDDQAILAYQITKVAFETPSPSPSPSPTVKVGDKCWNCDGRGKSGDGITDCMQCKGDGVINEGDPGLNRSDDPQSTEQSQDEQRSILGFVSKDAFDVYKQAVDSSINLINEHFKSLEERSTQAFSQASNQIDALQARVNQLEVQEKATELKLEELIKNSSLPQGKSEPKKILTPKYEYAIQYQGSYYYWSEPDKAFLNLTSGEQLAFPNMVDIKSYVGKPLQVCNDVICVECQVLPVQGSQ